MRCAATSAAGLRDADGAAAWLTRVAADEHALRMWGATNAVLAPLPSIRQQIFPWGAVARQPVFVRAVASLDAALIRARAEATRILDGLDPQEGR